MVQDKEITYLVNKREGRGRETDKDTTDWNGDKQPFNYLII